LKSEEGEVGERVSDGAAEGVRRSSC
jgi:hypothetical protein